MKLLKPFAYGICSFALASAAWAGGGMHGKSASTSPSETIESSSMSSESSSASTAAGDSSGAPWGATQSDASATGATRDSGESSQPELLSSEQSADSSAFSDQYSQMEENYWTQSGFSSSEELSLGG